MRSTEEEGRVQIITAGRMGSPRSPARRAGSGLGPAPHVTPLLLLSSWLSSPELSSTARRLQMVFPWDSLRGKPQGGKH